MRKLLLLLIAAISCSFLHAQGIKFETLSWNQLLEKAKKERRIIFIDAYATWCGPCKAMASNVFTTKEAGSFFNTKFINAKIDMEAGDGIKIAREYRVDAYPTYLFVNGDGKLLHKAIGYMETEVFLATAADALTPEKQFYTLKDWYNSGTITPAQLKYLVMKAAEINDENASGIASDYFKQQTNLFTKENIELMVSLVEISGSPDNEYYQFLLKNEAKAGAVVGEIELGEFLDNLPGSAALETADENASLPEIVTYLEQSIARYRPKNAQKTALGYGIYLATQDEDWDNYAKFTIAYADKYASALNELSYNELAWNFYLHVTETSGLKKALGWALQSVKMSSAYYNNDTVAHLYYKLGDKKNAKLYAEKAIQLGKESGEDVSATEELMQSIR